jgi:Ca2+-binding RTX toxin-like protein
MDGGGGNDTYEVDNANDVTGETSNSAAAGIDTVFARADHTLGFGLENLTMEGIASISGDGNDNDNVMVGNNGTNTLSGLDGDDTLLGGFGNDTLLGGLGDDTMRGERGADTLQGGAETDILIGGLNNDVFDFNVAGHSTGVGRDTIRGGDGAAAFEGVGALQGDRIDVSGIDANTGTAGNDVFIFGGAGVGHLTLVDIGGDTVVRGDTTAGGGFEFEVVIADGFGLFAGNYVPQDFVL